MLEKPIDTGLLYSLVPTSLQVLVAPPAPYLAYVKEKVNNSIYVSAQNSYKVGLLVWRENNK